MDRFYVGQKVRYRSIDNIRPELVGKVCSIVDGRTRRRCRVGDGGILYDHVYIVDMPLDGKSLSVAPEEHLEPIYDGDTPVAWSDCAWTPHRTATPL